MFNSTTSKKVLNHLLLPQFVACGAQSSGKSSVIRRISGISLPEASGLCTRITTIIQLRRCETPVIKVSLIGPNDEEIKTDTLTELALVKDIVAKYQEVYFIC